MRKKIVFAIIFVFVAFLAGMVWLLTTQSGLNTTLNIVNKMVPDLNVGEAKGELFGELVLSDIAYQPEQATAIAIEQLQFSWRPAELVKRHLHIQRLAVQGITISPVEQVEKASDVNAEINLPDIALPIRITLDQLIIRDVTLDNASAKTTLVEEAQLKAETISDELVIQTLSLSQQDEQFQLDGRIGLTDRHAVNLNYHVDLLNVFPEKLTINGQITGNQQQLVLTQQIQQPLKSEQTLVVSDLTSSLSWILTTSAQAIDVSKLVPEQELQLDNVNLHAEGTLTRLKSSLQATVKRTDIPAIDIDVNADSEDMAEWHIQAKAQPDNEKIITLSGKVNTDTPEIAFDLKAIWQQLQWPLQGDKVVVKSEHGEANLTGSIKDYQASINTVVTYENEPLTLTAQLQGDDTSASLKQLNINGFDGKITTHGQVDWSSSPINYELAANWQHLRLPASLSEVAVYIKQGQLSLLGNTNTMTLRSETDLTVNDVAMTINASGDGKTDIGFEQSQLHIQLGKGEIDYQGRLAWAGESLVDGHLTVNQFNPGIILPEWPGSLSGQAPLTVSQTDNQLNVVLDTLKLSGSLRQKPLAIEAKLSSKANDVLIDHFSARSAESTLSVKGKLQQDQMNVNWTLNSPDLQDFYPTLKGRLNGSGSLIGSLEQPRILANVDGKSLAFDTTKVEAINGDIDFTLQANANIDSRVTLTGLTLSELLIDRVVLEVTGKQQSHQIQLNLASKAINIDVAADGQLNQSTWTGQFRQFDFGNDQAGVWHLTQQGKLILNAKQQDIPRHCWQSEKGNLCIAASHSQDQWQTSGDFAELPLSLFEQFSAELEQIKGQLKGQFALAGDNHNVITGSGKIQLENASVQLNQSELNQKQAIVLKNTFIEYQLDKTHTTATLNLEPQIDGVSAINAHVETASIDVLMADASQAALTGEVRTNIESLAALQLTHPAIEGLKGKFKLNIDIGGTIAQPEILGKAQLEQGEVSIIDAGILLKNIQAEINGNLNKVDMTLTADSGEGKLNATGSYALNETGWELKANVSGKQLEVMNTPEALVIAEPDMTILVTPELTKVTGKVAIPRALIEPTRFNSSVSPSADVRVISNNTTEEQPESQTQVDLTVSLGDKVQIKALGFQGRLTGDLHVSGNPNDVLLGNGQIMIKDGSYVAYGQLLKVDNGKIRFSGPIDNPELDIKAVRHGKEVTAGLYIEGNVSSPQATLFSDPDMSQDNILSYLILGKPIEQASATDAALLASAATGIGLQNGAMIGDDIANTFGLDEFSITGDSKENAALTIGKYLSPKLYLSYGIGVFDSVSSVELRYQLSKIWSLKAESGTESGIDLLYTYEPKND
ncbi:translocation/assembly module TamB domain-containing protein [Methylophaga thalassica]|uniref:translocation/assembly module TamB domain-containing protein n=1 Tax=Methylophaga aminisulfidivorans TaxID=230105 RepID=UPI003A8F200B